MLMHSNRTKMVRLPMLTAKMHHVAVQKLGDTGFGQKKF